MTTVSLITGGAGGMGLETAKLVGADHAVVVCDVRQDRLDAAAATLKDLGIAVTPVHADVTDRAAVDELFATTAGLGTLVSVIHTAGVSPSMGDAEYVMRTNALGTVNVDEAFYATAGEGAAIVNVASVAAHMLPAEIIPTAKFPLALQDQHEFMTEMLSACAIAPEEARSGLAYAFSKSFVRWYSTSQAERFNGKGLRIVSVSPGRSTPRWASSRRKRAQARWSPTPPSRAGAGPTRWRPCSRSAPATRPATSPAPTSSTTAA